MVLGRHGHAREYRVRRAGSCMRVNGSARIESCVRRANMRGVVHAVQVMHVGSMRAASWVEALWSVHAHCIVHAGQRVRGRAGSCTRVDMRWFMHGMRCTGSSARAGLRKIAPSSETVGPATSSSWLPSPRSLPSKGHWKLFTGSCGWYAIFVRQDLRLDGRIEWNKTWKSCVTFCQVPVGTAFRAARMEGVS
jgi:hypothetical protein